MNIIELLRAQPGGHAALVEPGGGTVLRYEALLERVERMASQLAGRGVDQGQRVGIIAANGPETVVAFLAIARLGATAAPLNPGLTAREVGLACNDMAASALLVDDEGARLGASAAGDIQLLQFTQAPEVELLDSAPAKRSPPEPSPDDVCLLLQTSGTTSKPKNVPLKHRNLAASAQGIAAFYGLGTDDVTYCVMPLFHIHGIVGVTLSTLASGGSVVVPRRTVPSRVASDLERYEVTWVSSVPAILSRLFPTLGGGRRARMRFWRTSSSALPPDLMNTFESTLDVPLVEAYGMTEASHQMASNPLPPRERRPGSVGIATGTEVAVVDEQWQPLSTGSTGEVVVRGPGVIDGYLDNPDANRSSFRDGWFRTGDLGTVSPDGYLTLVGRIKEMINRAGEKIAPREIDEVLLLHPAVSEAVAYGVPDSKYGEIVNAAVVTTEPLEPAVLVAHCAELLASFKVPHRIMIVSEIPRGATGKIQRASLAKRLAP